MNSKVYKYCAVPQCGNTSITAPDKLFVFVPQQKTIRDKWLKLARRNATSISPSTNLYFCEDHFDLPNEMENYMEYHVMGYVPHIRMKPGCMPTRYQCQPDRRKRTSDATERSYILKKQRQALIEECERNLFTITNATEQAELGGTASGSTETYDHHNISRDIPKTADKSIQVYIITHKFRSKAIQTETKAVNQLTSPIKPSNKSISTSPFTIKKSITAKPSRSILQNRSRTLFTIEEESDSDISYAPSPSTSCLPTLSSDCSEFIEEDKKQEANQILEWTLLKIKRNPRFYIGVPKNCLYIIELIEKKTSIPAKHILLCLKKIRLNNPFIELADDFSMTSTNASKIFLKSIPLIASVMRPFIVQLEKDFIKQQLPMAFRHKFNNVSCIIDCLEIEIQKPSKVLNQSLSWSEYKKGNTVKYLVSCTPNGLVNYISQGYGGRITDTCIVEICNFNQCLHPGLQVMADRGFKHVEQYLRKNGVCLVRPPSVKSGVKLSKTEAKETKQIASLRIHVERVIRRLREFNMLKPHACVHHNLVKVLDDVITISCGLINLQDSLIK